MAKGDFQTSYDIETWHKIPLDFDNILQKIPFSLSILGGGPWPSLRLLYYTIYWERTSPIPTVGKNFPILFGISFVFLVTFGQRITYLLIYIQSAKTQLKQILFFYNKNSVC